MKADHAGHSKHWFKQQQAGIANVDPYKKLWPSSPIRISCRTEKGRWSSAARTGSKQRNKADPKITQPLTLLQRKGAGARSASLGCLTTHAMQMARQTRTVGRTWQNSLLLAVSEAARQEEETSSCRKLQDESGSRGDRRAHITAAISAVARLAEVRGTGESTHSLFPSCSGTTRDRARSVASRWDWQEWLIEG